MKLIMFCPRQVLALVFLAFSFVQGFSLDRRFVPGIWKLTSDALLLQPMDDSSIRSNQLLDEDPWTASLPSSPILSQHPNDDIEYDEENKNEILLRLNRDGSFRQCNEGYQEGSWLSGQWELVLDQDPNQHVLLLAVDRQYYGPRHDTLLRGKIALDTGKKKVVEGSVMSGKFMYPKKHPSFFDQTPIVSSRIVGNFSMEQAVSTESVVLPPSDALVKESEPKGQRFKASDFYNRTFILTIEPMNQQTSQRNKDVLLNQPVDIRAMPIQFHSNNTFQAFGINKILRGRFGVRDSEENELWFQVSLFGAGRSMPGSVYSEGMGLTHEDKRTYVGEILPDNKRLFVAGSVTFGSDLGTDARPEPVGTFVLTETKNNDSSYSSDSEQEDDTLPRSVFE